MPTSFTAQNDVVVSKLASANGQFIAQQKEGGELVIMKKDGTVVWNSNQAAGNDNRAYYGFSACPENEKCKYTLRFQPDCNLVTYIDKPANSFRNDVAFNVFAYQNTNWKGENTSAKPCSLKLQDNGNLVIMNNNNQQVWSSQTVQQ